MNREFFGSSHLFTIRVSDAVGDDVLAGSELMEKLSLINSFVWSQEVRANRVLTANSRMIITLFVL